MTWRWKKEPSKAYLTCKAASTQLRYAALLEARVVQFAHAVYEPEMQVKNMTEEGVQRKLIPPKIKITKIGRAIELLPNYVPFQLFDLKDPIQKHLVWQIRNVLDHLSMAALKQGSMEIITSATVLGSVIRRAKWTGIEALCGIVSGYLSSCMQPYCGIDYMGIGGVRFLRAVKSHPKVHSWKEYLNEGDVLWNGEICKINNIRWIELSDTSLLKNEAVVFGHQGLLLNEVQTPELRIFEGMIAWYGLLAIGSQNVLHIPERKRRWA